MKPKSILPLFSLFTALGAIAHPGGLDANGGHTDRKTGVYHYHRGTNAPTDTPLPPQSPFLVVSNGDVESSGIEMESGAAEFKELNAEAGSESPSRQLPWWVYLIGLGCGYLVWEIASRYYQKQKDTR